MLTREEQSLIKIPIQGAEPIHQYQPVRAGQEEHHHPALTQFRHAGALKAAHSTQAAPHPASPRAPFQEASAPHRVLPQYPHLPVAEGQYHQAPPPLPPHQEAQGDKDTNY